MERTFLSGTPVDSPPAIPESEELDINSESITKDEIMDAVMKLKNGKALGLTGIQPKANPATVQQVC